MEKHFVNLTIENIEKEHLCCAISDKKHQKGVVAKKNWLKERMEEGHIFRKLDEKGKVFIEIPVRFPRTNDIFSSVNKNNSY